MVFRAFCAAAAQRVTHNSHNTLPVPACCPSRLAACRYDVRGASSSTTVKLSPRLVQNATGLKDRVRKFQCGSCLEMVVPDGRTITAVWRSTLRRRYSSWQLG